MPAVALTKEQKLNKRIEDLTHDTKIALFDNGIQIKDVAAVAGISGPAVTNQFKRGQMTLSVYLAAQMLLEEK